MLTRDNFKQYMHEIENYESTVMDLYSNYEIDLIESALGRVKDSFLNLIVECMKDIDDWISYYCWELDFGKKGSEMKITIPYSKEGGKEYDFNLTDVDSLYDIITLTNDEMIEKYIK